MIGTRSANSIRASGQRPHSKAVYMTAPRHVCRSTKKPLPRGGRPGMTAELGATYVENALPAVAPHRAALAGRSGGRLRRLVAEDDAPARQVIRRHLDGDAIAHAGADAEFAHLGRGVGEDHVVVV